MADLVFILYEYVCSLMLEVRKVVVKGTERHNIIASFEILVYLPVSRVFAFPVNICRKSWYSRVSDTCIFTEEYMFMVLKKDMTSSNSPSERPPLFARRSPNLSQVQWGRIIGFGWCARSRTLSDTISNVFDKNSWNADLHLPVYENKHKKSQVYNKIVVFCKFGSASNGERLATKIMNYWIQT